MAGTTLGVISWGCVTAWGSVIEMDPRYVLCDTDKIST
jgi:hypothetical protein